MITDVERLESAGARDSFGNLLSPGLPYARGSILSNGEREFLKLEESRSHIQRRVRDGGPDALYNLSGLERGLPALEGDVCDDERSPAVYGERLRELALEHLGGSPGRDDVLLCNRQTSALFAALMVLVKPGCTVVGLSTTYSHPAVTRPTSFLGGRFVETTDVTEFEDALTSAGDKAVAVVTRLAVSYDGILPLEQLERSVAFCQRMEVPVLCDDAGGARVGPAVWGQPRLLQLGVDVGSTGLDKYGTVGPRLGLLGGRRELVAEITKTAFEYGLEARPMLYPAVIRSLEQYTEERVRDLTISTASLGRALHSKFGDAVTLTPVAVKIEADALLSTLLARSGLTSSPIVPYEATAAVAMVLLRDFGVLTVHFAGLPPGTAALLFKFVSPEVVARLGGPEKLAGLVEASIDQVAEMLRNPDSVRDLLLGATV